MSEEKNGGAEQPKPPAQPQMKILAQYIRDMSFENFVVRGAMTGEMKPQVEVTVGLDSRKRGDDGHFEVLQKYKVSAKAQGSDEMMFLLEIEYGGIFQIAGVPDEQLHPYTLIECPRMLFPYVRRIVGDITRDGGFPAVSMESIDFVALYRSEMQRRAQAEAANKKPA